MCHVWRGRGAKSIDKRDKTADTRRKKHLHFHLGPTRLVFGFVVLLRGIDREGVAHEVGEHGAVGETLDRVGGTLRSRWGATT